MVGVLRAPWRLVTAGRLLMLGLVLLAAAFVLWVVPSNDYAFVPDKAHPVAPLVSVAGGRNPKGPGGIYFVDVIVRKASVLEWLFGGFGSGSDLYPASDVVPAGESTSQEHQVDADEMTTSQQIAAAVALRALGRNVVIKPIGVLVSDVGDGYPATGQLIPTDVITAVDGTPVRTPSDLTKAMHGKTPGTKVTFTVLRGTETKTITLTTVPASPGSHRGIVGIAPAQDYRIKLPIRVSIDANGVGGPSAGLAFALEVMEKLGRNVDHGQKIAATGEIFLNGQVGPIGGIKQKTYGAREAGVDAFLVPAGENARDARRYAHGLRIIPVKSFQQALRALATLPQKR